MRFISACAACLCAMSAVAAPARAAEADGTGVSVTLTRHYTTNALNRPLALDDWYTALRGSIQQPILHEAGSTLIGAAFDLRGYDTYAVENDAAGGLSAATTIRASDALELRGTVSVNLTEEGDELAVGDAIIGMRTRRAEFAAGAQAGLRLSPTTVLVLEGRASAEKVARTRFQEDVLPPAKLEPGRDRYRLAAHLSRTTGIFSHGILAAGGLARTDPVGLLPQLRIADLALALHGTAVLPTGAKLAASAGIGSIRVLGTSFQQVRPTYDLAASMPLPAGFLLRGALRGSYDLGSKDDPIAVWSRRLEAEAGWQPLAALRFGTGAFLELRNNIGLETDERTRGVFGEAAWHAHESLMMIFRVDATRRLLKPSDVEHRTVDFRIALTAKL